MKVTNAEVQERSEDRWKEYTFMLILPKDSIDNKVKFVKQGVQKII